MSVVRTRWALSGKRFEFARFLLAGLANTAITYCLYLLLLQVLSYQSAYGFAYLAGIFTQYLLHSWFVYRTPLRWRRLFGYPVMHLLMYGIGAALLYLLVVTLSVNPKFAALLVVAASIPLGYLFSRLLFRDDQLPTKNSKGE